ncbi:MAG: histidinol dehydrogenase [Alphaproteobacteria bacterium RIFCSPLOWO2_01_FULL_40_26]|nr:MAG: histidinol dehydrogenase [Alphaproteobacteria bacterium RIFCSPHIGHO2_02_FULL_40_34]OFW94277.1 MAG: histidinol dehydrogenase [Alphaproteobacteria bacterium RIFCSPLOWO2_01_FULL_40_26]OFX09846.1 MAG: histidinol dehydrogenase [Alphaproteobacteria bacterium RIFCSPLOWO2_02_FULL_40_19]OFX12239.1 MAG: histidinol dehydrogenase [Alphaproteobacteria bacterium RIFCSPLOWO2_12_FULL_40_11]
MKIFQIKNKISKNLADAQKSGFYRFLSESQKQNTNAAKIAEKIIADIRKNGDSALISCCNKFDKTAFKKAEELLVSNQEILAAEKSTRKEVKSALKSAFTRIKNYHQKQMPKNLDFKDKDGVALGNHWRAIEKIGIYVPGGTASYPSSVLMSAVPAIVAGVDEIVMCTPTSAGKINSAILFAAKLCGIKKIYKIGGAQAIAALACGTKTIAKVDKIAGPGNAFVAGAKKILFGEVGIDMIAGPTDITIITDKNNNPDFLAADALSQLEHGHDSKAFILTDDENFAVKISASIMTLKQKLPRQKIIEKSLKNSAIFVIKNLDEAAHIVNFIAPEHLQIATKNPKKFLPKIRNAGAIFLGNYTPESIGDYMAGPSHTLPTSASAKFASGLSVFDFLKRISLISCDKNSFIKLAKNTAILAECEGLAAHKLSIEIRQ